jgi:hypothetical protein
MSQARRLALVAALALGGCGETKRAPEPAIDAARRVIEPPPGEVRPAPPFAIRSDGVGPYVIGAAQKDVLDLVPRGPRIELLELGLASYGLIRSEAGALLIGVAGEDEPAVRFVAVLAAEIATTASGIGVGASEDELAKAFAGAAAPPNRVLDPRLREFTSLPGVQFVVDGGRVVAVIAAPFAPSPEPEPPENADCRAGGALAAARDAVVAAARLESETVRVQFGCFTSAAPEALVSGGGRLAIVVGPPDRPRRVAVHRLSGDGHVGPLDADRDGRDEIGAVYHAADERERSVRVELLRVEGGKLASLIATPNRPYAVTAAAAAMAGARLPDVDLLVSLGVGERTLDIGGLYLHRDKGRARAIAPLEPRSAKWRRDRPK